MLENLDTIIAFATVMLLLSLLITTLVQMAVAVLGLRGKVLLDGTRQLITQLNPNLKDQAASIAEKVLTHPAIGERTGLIQALFRKAGSAANAAAKLKPAVAIRREELILILKDLADGDSGLTQETKDQLATLFTDTPGKGSAEMIAKTGELLQKLESKFPQQAQDLRSAVEGVLGTTQTIVVRVDSWFDTVMDRTSDVFKVYTRWITIGVAVVFALLLHVDSLAILDQISEDKDLRARLVQMSETVRDEGKTLLALEPAGPSPEAVQARLKELNDSLKRLQGHLGETQLEIIPSPIPWFWEYTGWRNALGVLMTACFLSLGAPFWYNALRKLSDLRPIVARRVEGELPKEAPKKSG